MHANLNGVIERVELHSFGRIAKIFPDLGGTAELSSKMYIFIPCLSSLFFIYLV